MADSPFYRLFRRIDLTVPFRTWERLPRIPAFKNEYWDGCARYTPRPNTVDIYLDLANWSPPPDPPEVIAMREPVSIRPLRAEDWPALWEPFVSAFIDQPPLVQWGKGAGRGARAILNWTRQGRDGALVPSACFAAWTRDEHGAGSKDKEEWICGAAIVTLTPRRQLRGVASLPPLPAIPAKDATSAPGDGMPHLGWIFVNRWLQRSGIATMLLGDVVAALRAAGHARLASTCLESNPKSLLWHWRNGFVLPPNDFWIRRAKRASGGVGTTGQNNVK